MASTLVFQIKGVSSNLTIRSNASLEYLVIVRWTENPEVVVQFHWEAPSESKSIRYRHSLLRSWHLKYSVRIETDAFLHINSL